MNGMSKPTKRGGEKKDRHKSARNIRLSDDVFLAMQKLAAENDRAMTREVRQALIAWLTAKGKWPESDSST
jgi:predicted transcriptional regulator